MLVFSQFCFCKEKNLGDLTWSYTFFQWDLFGPFFYSSFSSFWSWLQNFVFTFWKFLEQFKIRKMIQRLLIFGNFYCLGCHVLNPISSFTHFQCFVLFLIFHEKTSLRARNFKKAVYVAFDRFVVFKSQGTGKYTLFKISHSQSMYKIQLQFTYFMKFVSWGQKISVGMQIKRHVFVK